MKSTRWNIVLAIALLLGSGFCAVGLWLFISRPATGVIADVTYGSLTVIVCLVTGAAWLMARAAIPSAKWDLALISAFLMLQATTWLRLSNYLSGRTNAAAADLCFAYFWFGVLAAVLLWGGYVVLAVLAHNKVTHVQNVARAVGICVMAVIIVAAIFAPAPGEQAFHRGFRQWLGEKELDIPSIRTWQSSLGVTPGGDVPQDLWPRSVRVLEPRVVRFLGPKAGVDIRWGGGFLGMWGVVVGPDRLEIPAEDCGTYIVVFRQGVYMHFPKG